MENNGVVDAGIAALIGYAVVIVGLLLVLVVAFLLGRAIVAAFKKKAEPAPEPVAAPVEEAPAAPTAPGSAGGVKLHDVEPKTAAMLMAIVADKMGKPLNELRFISIKEVK